MVVVRIGGTFFPSSADRRIVMPDLEITNVEAAIAANPWKPWVFVRVETDAGITGYGEATTMPPERGIDRVNRFGDGLIGENPFDTGVLFTPRSPVGRVDDTTRSALDIALWDIKGKYFDCPIYDLLGGSIHGTKLRSYANGWYTDIYADDRRDPAKFAACAAAVVDAGYDAMKFDPFGNAWRRMDRADLNLSIDCVRAVREAVGPDVDLLIEGHQRFSVPMAMEVANQLEPFHPAWFEEPTPPDVHALQKVAASSPVPIATAESIRGIQNYPDLLHDTHVGIIQSDVIHVGGITNLYKVAAMADAEHVDIAPHMASGWITLAASLHVDTAIPNFMIQENFVEFAFPEWADEIVDEPIETDDGCVQVPDRPGLGIELDWDAIESHSMDAHGDEINVIDLYAHRWEDRANVAE